jgi:hypothetical protein
MKKVLVLGSIVFATSATSANAQCFFNGFQYVDRNETICYPSSMEQYGCRKDSKGFYWTYVQKLSLKSSLRDKGACTVVMAPGLVGPPQGRIN